MRSLLTRGIVALVLFFMGCPLMSAHPGHGSAISSEEAAMQATTQVARLVDEDKLESSWKVMAELKTVEVKQYEETMEYVVVFFNPEASDPERNMLYVFLTETGEYVAANFSGH